MSEYDGLLGGSDDEDAGGSSRKIILPGDPESVLSPKNRRAFLRDKCKLKVAPYNQINGVSSPYVDLSEGSKCSERYDLLTQPLPKGKIGILILEPRGSGKSAGCRSTSMGEIVDDPTSTHVYTAQTLPRAQVRVNWVRNRIAAAYPHMKNPDHWAKGGFTVVGAAPYAEDPTMVVGAPGNDIEGAHAGKYWLDDIVTDANNNTYNSRTAIIEWFVDLQKQFTAGTRVCAVGTRHKGHNLWEEIIDHYQDSFVVHIVGCYDEDTGKNFYPWLTKDFLEMQRKPNEIEFRLKYLNEKAVSEDVIFTASMLQYGTPPTIASNTIPGGKRLDPRLAVYMLTDTAQTDRVSKRSSETVFIIIAKDHDETIYICDIDIGHYTPAIVEERFLKMYERWRPHGLRYATMENTGPGKSYMSTIPRSARLDPQCNFVPAIIPLARTGGEDKDARISACFTPFSKGQYQFVKEFLDPKMFRIDDRGTPRGVAADRILNYSSDGLGKKDFLDALADEAAAFEKGLACPAPSPSKVKKTKLSDYDRALRGTLTRRNSIRSF